MAGKKKTKVMHVLKSSIYSGAENVAITIIKQLQDEYEFVYVATDGPIRTALERESVPFELLESFNRRQLVEVINKYQPDIIHAHDFSATVACGVAKGSFRLISQLHYDPPWVQHWNMKTFGYMLCKSRINRVLTVSEKSFQNMTFCKQYQNRCIVIGNPIDGNKIRWLSQQADFQEQNEACDLIFVGRLVEQKNPQRFIGLIEQLKTAGWKKVKAWMLGEGELRAECEAMIVSKNLQDNISLKGFQDNPYPYMKRAHVMCVTSRWEGYGLVAIEANMLGIPVLSTDNSGCSEILGERAEELCRTDEEFIEKIEMLRDKEERYEQWKERSLKRAKRYDNIEKYMATMSSIYRNEVFN